jgi:hypothetical protein
MAYSSEIAILEAATEAVPLFLTAPIHEGTG